MYLGEIRLFAFEQVPHDWLPCDGRSLNVRENQALYSLLSSTYGGDGVKTFNLPDLRGNTPVHQNMDKPGRSNNLPVGTRGGAAAVSLQFEEMPGHTHALRASAETANIPSPAANFLAAKANAPSAPTVAHRIYAEGDGDMVVLAASTLSAKGGSASHDNMQPYLSLNFCICVRGDYPPRAND